MKDNTFKVVKNGNEHIGSISGIQIQSGYPRKYYLHIDVMKKIIQSGLTIGLR
jgi:hypothetical protein